MRSFELAYGCCLVLVIHVASIGAPPSVSSGNLVAQFLAEPGAFSLGASNEVLSWTASNDPGIVLSGFGTPVDNLIFDPTELGGHGAVVVNDFSGDNRVLRGSLGGVTLSYATVFWLGYYQPGRDGSLTSGSGQYVYSFGRSGSNGSQLDHQIDDGHFELWGGSGTQRGASIDYLSGHYSVWQTQYLAAPTTVSHQATANGVDLQIPTDPSGYNAGGPNPGDDDLQLFGWQNSSGVSGGFNFVGNMAELLIYDGVLDSNDTSAVENYLRDKLVNDPPPPPAPEPTFTLIADISGLPNTQVPGFVPHGDPQISGLGVFTFDPNTNTMDWDITLNDDRYEVTQAHFYNINDKPNGDSIFCWGGRWSNHDFLQGEGFAIAGSTIEDIRNNPEDWMVIIHTEGGHFAVDVNGDLIPYNAGLHETSVTGQVESGSRYNNRVGRMLDNLLLREQNPHSGGFGAPTFDGVYPDANHFLREAAAPFADALGNVWIEFDANQGKYVPSAYGISKGLTQADIDNNTYLFYRYDDQGPSWDYGGPEGAAGGFLVVPEPGAAAVLLTTVGLVGLGRRGRQRR